MWQGNSPRDREEWVDDISRIILKLQGDDVPRFGKQGPALDFRVFASSLSWPSDDVIQLNRNLI